MSEIPDHCTRCGGSGDDPAMSSGYTPRPCEACSRPQAGAQTTPIAQALRLASQAGWGTAGEIEKAAATVAAFLDAMNGQRRRAGYNLARDVEEAARAE